MNKDRAIVIALAGVGFLAAEPEWMDRFVALTGLGAEELKKRLDEPAVLAGVLGFVMSDDAMAEPFCQAETLSPQELLYAQHLLDG